MTKLSAAFFFIAISAPVHAAPVDFNRDVRPILSENCFYCHGQDPNKREADLRLDVRDVALKLKAFVPGKADASELITRINTDDRDDLMPPPKPEEVDAFVADTSPDAYEKVVERLLMRL